MARHLTLADIGRGASRHRARRRRLPWVAGTLLALVAFVGAGVAFPPVRHLTGSFVGASAGGCGGNTTSLTMASSAEKAPLLARFAADFSRDGRDTQGRCVKVTIVNKTSGAAMSALAEGWPDVATRPDVWSPSGSVWLPLLEAQLAESQRSSMIPTPLSVPALATSPLVIAMPRPMAEVLGWPRTPLGWADILRLGSRQTGWAAYGHPEWGQFLLGKTNPNLSHAGLEGTIAAYYAATGRTSGLTVSDVGRADVRRFVAGVEQSIVRYGDSTPAYSVEWRRADDAGQSLSFISALVTEENLVAAYNQGNPTADPALNGRTTPPKVPLVAIYPKEGTFLADHPYTVLSAPWVTQAKRDAAAAFLDYLRSSPIQREFQANHFRDAAGHPGPGAAQGLGLQPAQPTRVLDTPTGETTLAILHSWSQLRKTANVISLIDVSGSMGNVLEASGRTRLDAAKQAAVTSLDMFTDRDEVGLWSFSGGQPGVRDYTEHIPVGPMNGVVGPIVRREAIRQAISGLQAGGDTGLYNSIAAAYQQVLARYQPGRINAVVVLTDGRNDARGGLTLQQLLNDVVAPDATGRQVRVITIAYGPEADQIALARIAHATKGASYVAPSPTDIPKVYAAALSNV